MRAKHEYFRQSHDLDDNRCVPHREQPHLPLSLPKMRQDKRQRDPETDDWYRKMDQAVRNATRSLLGRDRWITFLSDRSSIAEQSHNRPDVSARLKTHEGWMARAISAMHRTMVTVCFIMPKSCLSD